MTRLMFMLLAIVFLSTHVDAVVYTCDFSSANLCDQWFQNDTDTFDWKRQSGAISDNRGPESGFGGKGYYMYTDVDGVTDHQESRLESLELEPGKVRLLFWCNLYGSGIAYLKVFKKIGKINIQVGDAIYRRDTRDWIFKSLKFDCAKKCKIVFVGTKGSGWKSDISIDQVKIEVTNPIKHTHQRLDIAENNAETWYCSFDTDNCSQYWSQDNTDEFDWIHTLGRSITEGTGPPSGYKGSGYYMLMDASYHRSGQKGRLESEVITEANVTLTFWYLMYGYDVGRLKVYTKSEDTTNFLWSKLGDSRVRAWHEKRLDFLCESTCRVVFEAENGVFEHGDIAIDEISLNIVHDIPRDLSQTKVLRDFCDFDSDLGCGWRQDSGNHVEWQTWKGTTPKRNTGPTGDFTTGRGNYALFQDSTDRINTAAVMTSPVTRAPFWRRLMFAYHMLQYDNQTSTLKVYKKFESSGDRVLLLTVPRKEGMTRWQVESLNVTSQEPYAIQIEAVGGRGGYGDIALDNIELTSGVLPDIANCEFSTSFCKWSQSTSDDFDWLLHSGETHTSGTGPTGKGQYAYTDASFPRVNGDVAIVESEAIGPLGNQSVCIRFLYNMFGKQVGKLQLIQTDRRGNSGSVLWIRSGNQGRQWWQGYVTVKFVNDEVLKLRFKAQRRYGIRGDIAIKDVMTEMRSCREESPYDCNFETDMCHWTRTSAVSGNWSLSRGPTNNTDFAPLADHTTGSRNGGYVFVSDVDARPSIHVAVNTKESLCVSFWYFSYGSDNSDKIDFWTQLQDGSMPTIKWMYNSETVTWQHARVTVQSNLIYNMGFQARAVDGFKAIDDIVVTNGACA